MRTMWMEDAPGPAMLAAVTLMIAVSLVGCGPSGGFGGGQEETWNSYYYGMPKGGSYGSRDSDDDYQLPRQYQVFEGAREPRIMNENLIHPN